MKETTQHIVDDTNTHAKSHHVCVFITLGDAHYIGGCSIHRGDIMMHVGEQVGRNISISIENSDLLNIPQCTHAISRCTEHPPMYSWYGKNLSISIENSDVLNIPQCTYDIPRCTEHPPMYL